MLLIDLGAHAHRSCLVALAMRRISRCNRGGVRRAEQGWCTRAALCILLELVPNDVNVFIFRARHQWMTALPNLGELIERRWDAFSCFTTSVRVATQRRYGGSLRVERFP